MLRPEVPDKVVAPVVHMPSLGLSAPGDAAPVPGAVAVERLVRLLVPLEVLLRGKGLVAAGLVAAVLLDVVPLMLAVSIALVTEVIPGVR